MSGARLATTALYQLMDTRGRYGLCTMCIGVGQGIAARRASLGERRRTGEGHDEVPVLWLDDAGAFWIVLFVNLAFPAYGSGVINNYMAIDLHLNRQMVGLPYSVYLLMSGLPGPSPRCVSTAAASASRSCWAA